MFSRSQLIIIKYPILIIIGKLVYIYTIPGFPNIKKHIIYLNALNMTSNYNNEHTIL